MCDIHADSRMCYYTGYMCRNRSLDSMQKLRTTDNPVIEKIRRIRMTWTDRLVAYMTGMSR